jgi:MerR family transcriptional regulator, light-induced transcriptional regulator
MRAKPATPASPSQSPAEHLYPIRTVCSMTGINPMTLRAWERRHGLIKPTRTQGGHRVYKQSDIDAIHRIVSLLDKGVSIGQVGKVMGGRGTNRAKAPESDIWARTRDEMTLAIGQFDENRLEGLYNDALARYPLELVTQRVLMPLLAELGTRWEQAAGSIAEEHFFGVYLRNKLGARFHHRGRDGSGPKLLAACLPGEWHETGLLLFALAAHEKGFRLVLLGANMPLPELPIAARRSQSQAIVLSGSMQGGPALFTEELPRLAEDASVPVLVGGQISVSNRDAIVLAGATPLGTHIETALDRIGKTLGTRASHRSARKR